MDLGVLWIVIKPILWELRYVILVQLLLILMLIYKSVKRRGLIPKIVNWAKNLPKEYVIITLIATAVSVSSVLLFVNFPFNEHGWTGLLKNLLPNIIVDAISIVITAFIITHFISKAQGRKEKRESFQTIRVHHSLLVSNLATMYNTMMSKRPSLYFIDTYTGTSSNYRFQMTELKWSSELVNTRIDDDFFEREVVYTLKIFPDIIHNSKSESSRSNAYACKHEYVLDYFLESTKIELEKFITKYSAFIPKELTRRIVNLESIILADKELVPWLPNGLKKWTTKDYVETYEELGLRIYALFEYYEEFYQD